MRHTVPPARFPGRAHARIVRIAPARLTRSRLALLLLTVAPVFVACATERLTEAPPVATIAVTPSGANLTVGGTLALKAEVADGAGTPVDSLPVFWSSSDETVAVVNDRGVVTARKAGDVRIAATAHGVSAVANLRVRSATATPPPAPPPAPPAVAGVTIVLASHRLRVGESRQAVAVLRAANGDILTGRTVTWRTSDDRTAAVSFTGVITGRRHGNAVITAIVEGKSDALTVQVRRDDDD